MELDDSGEIYPYTRNGQLPNALPDVYDETAGLHPGAAVRPGAEANAEEARLWDEYVQLELLNNQVLGSPVDVAFQTDALAAGIGVDPDALVPVMAPTAEVLAQQGLIGVLDAPSQVEYFYGRILQMNDNSSERWAAGEIAGYGVCEVEHAALTYQAHHAVADMTAAMLAPQQEQSGGGYTLETARDGTFALTSGELVPVVYSVTAHYNQEGALHDQVGLAAIRVAVGHRAADSEPQAVGAGPLPRMYSPMFVRAHELMPLPFAELTNNLTERVCARSWRSAVEPWATAFSALPGPTRPPREEIPDLVDGMPLGVHWALHTPSENNDELLRAFRMAFGPNIPGRWEALTAIPADDLLAYAEEYGVTDRLLWLLHNAPAINEAVREAERVALDAEFRDEFFRWQAAAEQRVAVVATIARNLETFLPR